MSSNSVATKVTHVAGPQMRSDMDRVMRYKLMGPGADEEPYDLFIVDEMTGFVRLFGILDREEIPSYMVSENPIMLINNVLALYYMMIIKGLVKSSVFHILSKSQTNRCCCPSTVVL